MFVPYSVDVPMERWPYANWALIALTCVLSLAILFGAGRPDRRAQDRELQRVLDELERKKAKPEEIFRALEEAERRQSEPAPPLALVPSRWSLLQLFTSLFVHGSLLHLLGNMVFLFVFGNAVNAKLGHWQFLVAYLLLGALSSVAWLLLGTGQPLVGASGAIMGIVGIFLVLYPRNDITVLYRIGIAYGGVFTLSSYWIILLYLAMDLAGAILAGGGGVAYVCHLAGAAGGFVLATAGLVAGWIEPAHYEETLPQMLGLMEKEDRHRPVAGKKKQVR